MRYRQFLHQGKPTDRVDATTGGEFGTPDAVGIAEVAEALGVPAAEVTVAHSDEPPAAARVIIPPQVGEPAPPTLGERFDALVSAIAGARDLAEIKAAAAGIKAEAGRR